jgi:hypothetical protein
MAELGASVTVQAMPNEKYKNQERMRTVILVLEMHYQRRAFIPYSVVGQPFMKEKARNQCSSRLILHEPSNYRNFVQTSTGGGLLADK